MAYLANGAVTTESKGTENRRKEDVVTIVVEKMII